MTHAPFKLIPATFTPFTDNGELNLPGIDRQAQVLSERGIGTVFVNGTTGEGASMSLQERETAAARWVNAARPLGLKVIVHVGHANPREAAALAGHAQSIGADGAAALAPYFFRPATVQELVEVCAIIAAGAPELPFYYYHIPSMTGVYLNMHEFLPAAADRIPNLAGVKFTFENLMDYQLALNLQHGRFDCLFGRDELLLAALVLGAQGAVGSTYNFLSPLFDDLIKAFNDQNLGEARTLQLRAQHVIQVGVRFGGLPAFKVMAELTGLPCGPTRRPLVTLNDQQRDALTRELNESGLLKTP